MEGSSDPVRQWRKRSRVSFEAPTGMKVLDLMMLALMEVYECGGYGHRPNATVFSCIQQLSICADAPFCSSWPPSNGAEPHCFRAARKCAANPKNFLFMR